MLPWAEMESLRCGELANLIDQCPIVYVPNGIYEWHEAQNPMGTDTIKVVEMAKRAARLTGGAVHMPLYIGAGAFYGKTGPLKHGGINFEEAFVRDFLLKLYEQLDAMGFELIVVLFGHTNTENFNAHELSAAEYMQRVGARARVLTVSESSTMIKYRANKVADHAAKWETSFMLALCPDRVAMQEIDPNHGSWHGLDPRLHASAAAGEFALNKGAEELASLVRYAFTLTRAQMLDFSYDTGSPCWRGCLNIADLETGYWQGDFKWEDPSCPFCIFRSPGVVKKLAEIKGRAWVERLIAQYERDFTGFKPGSRIRRNIAELSAELIALSTG
jgi:creatinine amidohydrolase